MVTTAVSHVVSDELLARCAERAAGYDRDNKFFQEDFDAGTISTNAGFAQKGSEARFQSGLASIPNPSALETGLQIAGAGVSGFSQGQAISARIPTSKAKSVAPASLAIRTPTFTGSSPAVR